MIFGVLPSSGSKFFFFFFFLMVAIHAHLLFLVEFLKALFLVSYIHLCEFKNNLLPNSFSNYLTTVLFTIIGPDLLIHNAFTILTPILLQRQSEDTAQIFVI